MESLITMSEIARLAGVRRQAVTNWRSRPATAPFPTSVRGAGGLERFEREEVLEWLEVTGRGNNPEARIDAPALVAPAHLEVESAVVLLALRAAAGDDLGPMARGERLSVANNIDPSDLYLQTEVRGLAQDDALAAYVDELMAASFGPADALGKLYSTRAAQGARGLAADLIDLLCSIADVCRTYLGPDDVAVDLRLEPRARRVGASFPIARATESADRASLRRLALEGLTVEETAGSCVSVISVLELGDEQALDAIDDLALELGAGEVAVVVGSTTVLCDGLRGDLDASRKRTLRMGEAAICSLAAAFRLPRGLWGTAYRQGLGLWVLQGGGGADSAVVGDVTGVGLDPEEFAADIMGALERTGARAYRYGRRLPYSSLLARSYVVAPGLRAVNAGRADRTGSPLERLSQATLVTTEEIGPFDLAGVAGGDAGLRETRSLGQLSDDHRVSVRNGSRIRREDLDATSSLRVIGADVVTAIDPFVAADRYDHAIRTEPGDVVFTYTPQPAAVVDETGGAIVISPNRIIRLGGDAGIGPHALAAAINQSATGREWRAWPVPNVPREQIQPLEDALAAANAHLANLRRHEAATTSIISNLIQGVAEGSVALGSASTDRKAG